MKRGVIAAILIIGLFVLWEVLRGGPSDEGVYLGYVEGDLLYIGPIEGERLGSLSVDAGSQVETGAPLFSMETPLLDAQHNEAAARIGQMDANLENLKAALNRPQQVAVLQAAVDRAEAELKLSQLTFDRQQKLYAARDVSKATLDNAQMALSRDQAALAEAKRQVDAALLTGARRRSRAPRPRCGRRARSFTSSTSASPGKRFSRRPPASCRTCFSASAKW